MEGRKESMERMRELQELCLDIQMHGKGEDGHPYVGFETGNYGYDVIIKIMDNGFGTGKAEHDGYYGMDFECSDTRRYEACKEHLLRMKRRIFEEDKHEDPED